MLIIAFHWATEENVGHHCSVAVLANFYNQFHRPCCTHSADYSGTSRLEHIGKVLWVLSTHRNLPPFYNFFDRNAWVLYANSIIL